jgi:hypothetical protein
MDQHDVAASSGQDAVQWLLLTYRLPDKRASLRTTVRRKLSAAGAVYLLSACAAAPMSGRAQRTMRRMCAIINGAGGSAVLMAGRALVGEPELTGAFNAVRNHEYEAIITDCHDAVAGLAALAAACEFRYQSLWDKDIGLRRLSVRYLSVHDQDLFGARQAEEAAVALAGYRSALNEYATSVYAADSRAKRPG